MKTLLQPQFCLFAKAYFDPEEQDRFLTEVLRPLAHRATQELGFDYFFFMRYVDPKPHLRIRFFGSRSAVLGPGRDVILQGIKKAVKSYSHGKMITAKYRPEWTRYGGKLGVRTAERIFFASSHAVMDYFHLQNSGLQVSKVEFALASAEAMLHGIGLDEAGRQTMFKTYRSKIGSPEIQTLVTAMQVKLEDKLRLLVPDPKNYWSAQDCKELAQTTAALYENLKQAREIWSKESKKISVKPIAVSSSYFHMHLNRLGLYPRYEEVLRCVRAEFKSQTIS